MSAIPASGNATAADPAAVVEAFLTALMIPDPQTAKRYVAPDLEIRFTGNRLMHDPAECAAFNRSRYQWVKKRFERTEVVRGGDARETVVYNIGTLYGAWPDGSAFEGNRYVDRYTLRHGLIAKMEVWNDSAEILLARAGLVAP